MTDVIRDMVTDMVDEHELRETLDGIVKSIFQRQMEDAFTWEGGPLMYWRHIEAEWRKVTHGKPIPTKYRTNKSCILKAYRADSSLDAWRTEGGTLHGKTQVEKMTKDKTTTLTSRRALGKITRVMDKLPSDEARENVAKQVYAKWGSP